MVIGSGHSKSVNQFYTFLYNGQFTYQSQMCTYQRNSKLNLLQYCNTIREREKKCDTLYTHTQCIFTIHKKKLKMHLRNLWKNKILLCAYQCFSILDVERVHRHCVVLLILQTEKGKLRSQVCLSPHLLLEHQQIRSQLFLFVPALLSMFLNDNGCQLFFSYLESSGFTGMKIRLPWILT